MALGCGLAGWLGEPTVPYDHSAELYRLALYVMTSKFLCCYLVLAVDTSSLRMLFGPVDYVLEADPGRCCRVSRPLDSTLLGRSLVFLPIALSVLVKFRTLNQICGGLAVPTFPDIFPRGLLDPDDLTPLLDVEPSSRLIPALVGAPLLLWPAPPRFASWALKIEKRVSVV